MKPEGPPTVKHRKEELLRLYHIMLTIRRFEERVVIDYHSGAIPGIVHSYIGQEAVATGVCTNLRKDDRIISNHRGHGHCIAKGADMKRMMAEIYGKKTGYCKGKGGSMHMFSKEKHFYGGHGIVAGQVPLGTGIAFAHKYREDGGLCTAYMGDGAVNQGQVYESFNMAALWKLPCVYICENNRYGMGTAIERASAIYDVAQRACAYDMASETVDGMDVLAVHEAVTAAVDRARAEHLPTLIEARTYRYMGHSMADPIHGHYRTKEELEEQKAKDPIQHLSEMLREADLLDDDTLQQMRQSVEEEVDDAMKFAEASPDPEPDALFTDVYRD